MTPVKSSGSHAGLSPRSVAKTTSWPARVKRRQGTATSVVSKSLSGRGMRTRFLAMMSIVLGGADELVFLLREENVERRQRSVAACDVLLELDLVLGGQAGVTV